MNLQQKINDYVRLILNKFKGTSKDSLEINETLSRLDTITKNQIWYRGDSYEIKQIKIKVNAIFKISLYISAFSFSRLASPSSVNSVTSFSGLVSSIPLAVV